MATRKTQNKRVKTLTIFSEKLTDNEAKAITTHAGPVMYPNTLHNRKAIAKQLKEYIQKLHSKKN